MLTSLTHKYVVSFHLLRSLLLLVFCNFHRINTAQILKDVFVSIFS